MNRNYLRLCINNYLSEETVFHASIKWLNNQQRVPKSFHNVLEHIRLPLLTPYFIHDVVERTAAVSESAECRHLVEEVSH